MINRSSNLQLILQFESDVRNLFLRNLPFFVPSSVRKTVSGENLLRTLFGRVPGYPQREIVPPEEIDEGRGETGNKQSHYGSITGMGE